MRYALGLLVLLAWGCASGEENYKELERDSGDPFQTERDPLFRGTSAPPPPPPPPPPPVSSPAPADGVEIVRTDEPSIHGLNRSHWPTIRFTAAAGVDGAGYVAPVDHRGVAPEQRFEAALGGAEAGNWSWGNVMGGRRGIEGGAGAGGAGGAGGMSAPRSPAGP